MDTKNELTCRVNALKRRIWITRKARIHASERLAKGDFYSKLIMAYYSFATLSFSIIELKIRHLPTIFKLSDVLLGVLLFGSAIYVNTLSFSTRSAALKDCYLKLGKLELKIPSNSNLSDSQLSEISEEYNKILEGSENHSEYDYYSVAMNSHDNSISISANEIFKYWGEKILSWAFIIGMFTLPLLVGGWALL